MGLAQHALADVGGRSEVMARRSPARTAVTADARYLSAAIVDRAVGLVLMAVLPALFWVALLGLGGWAAGSPFTAITLAMVGGGIAAFLAMICSAPAMRGMPDA